MIKLINSSQFLDSFKDSQYSNKYSRDGLEVIYKHLEELYQGNYQLDIPEVAGAYSEYENLQAYNEDYFGKDIQSYHEDIEDIEYYTLYIDGDRFLTVDYRLLYQ